MPTLTTSYQYLGTAPESGPVIKQAGSYYSRLYIQAKVASYNTNNATLTVRVSIRNNWMSWSSYGVTLALTGADTHKFVDNSYLSIGDSGSASYADKWSSEYSFNVNYGTFNLGASISGNAINSVSQSASCTVNAPTYTVTYNANGGTGAPAAQVVNQNETCVLSSQVPTKDATLSTPYTVTFNANSGAVDASSLISYNRTGSIFSKWNTKSDGSGTNYDPGATYTAKTSVTLYAQWTNTTARDKIILPSGSRNGYKLKGYGTSASATSTVADPYTPSGNVTLYALWDTKKSLINYKNGSTWTAAPLIKVKIDDTWYVIPNIKITW